MFRTLMAKAAAAALLLLAGCAAHSAATDRGRPYAQRAARHGHHVAHRGHGPGQEEWTVVCDDTPALPPTIPQPCRLQTAVRQSGPVPAAATISSPDGGRTWTVAAMPSPGAVRLKVGGRSPVDADCSQPGDACTVTGEDAARLTRDLQAGRAVDTQVLTTGGTLDRRVSLYGFTRELKKARALVAPATDSAAPQPPAAPPASPAASPVAASPVAASPVAASPVPASPVPASPAAAASR